MTQTDLFEPLEFVVEHRDKQLSFRFDFYSRIEPRRADVPNARIKAPVEATATSEAFPTANKAANNS